MRMLIGLITAMLLLTPAAEAHDYTIGQLQIAHPWVRATPPGATTAGAFLSVTNTGTEADRLIGATSPAGKVEIHMMDVVNGIMRMRPVPDGLDVPAGGTLELKPGGFHLMVLGLTAPFQEGHRVLMTLIFQKAGEVTVELAVEPIGAPAPMSNMPIHQHQ